MHDAQCEIHPHWAPLLLLLLQAFAADSADQSPWIYYRWLLGNSLAHLQEAQQQQQQQGQQQQQQETTAGGSSSSVEEAQVVLAEVCVGWHPPGMGAALLL